MTMKVWSIHKPGLPPLFVAAESVHMAIIWAEDELLQAGIVANLKNEDLIPFSISTRNVRILGGPDD